MSKLLQVFARAPIRGQVKTRIAKELGDDVALNIHKRLCEKAVLTALSSDADAVEAWTTDASTRDYFEAMAVECWVQQGVNLGTRMDFAMRHGLARHQRVIILGSDALSVSPAYLAEAFRSLEQSEVVVGPATDGGYVLIGATRPVPELFRDMPWGTNEVMGHTLERLLSRGLGFHILGERWDVDTVQDVLTYIPDWLER